MNRCYCKLLYRNTQYRIPMAVFVCAFPQIREVEIQPNHLATDLLSSIDRGKARVDNPITVIDISQ